VVALTYHDKIVGRRTFPFTTPDILFAHRDDVGIGERILIPQGIALRRPVVKTFGLGKSRDDLIAPICDRNGWQLETSFGEHRWLSSDELFAWLRDCDAIVLWYDEDLNSGASAAAPLAIGTRRHVFVNDTEWFRDLPDRTATLHKVRTLEELEARMRGVLVDEYAEARSWDRVAQTTIEAYAASLEKRDGAAGPHKLPVRSVGFAALDQKPFSFAKHRLLKRRP
jgi:hypothetical protein